MVKFSEELLAFMQQQKESAVGERLRLLKKERHAETLFLHNIWEELRIGFSELIAEYEFQDINGRIRFIDFVFVMLKYFIAIEIDGFETHVTKMDRDKFADMLVRQNSLSLMGFIVVRFSYDQIVQNPQACVQFLKTLIGKLSAKSVWQENMTANERSVVRFAMNNGDQCIRVQQVMEEVGLSAKTARKLLGQLVERNYLIPHKRSERVSYYRLNSKVWNSLG